MLPRWLPTALKVLMALAMLAAVENMLQFARMREIAAVNERVAAIRAERHQVITEGHTLAAGIQDLTSRFQSLQQQHKVLRDEAESLRRLDQEAQQPLLAESPLAGGAGKEEEEEAAAAAAAQAEAEDAGDAARPDDGLHMPPFPANQVVDAAPFCRPLAAGRKTGLPKFVFVAGVEGSGHHALVDVWVSLQAHGLKLKLIVYDQVFHSLGIENHASYHYSSIQLDTYRKNMGPVFAQAAKEGVDMVIDAQNSYPMGMGAGSLAHPDLLALQQLDGELFDLRVIVLYRDPTSATLSAVRRFKDDADYRYKTFKFQARMVSENLIAINNALPLLPCSRFMVIKYADLTARPNDFVEPIAQLLGVPADHIRDSFSGIKQRPKHEDSPEVAAMRTVLSSFFSTYEPLWPHLSGLLQHTADDNANSNDKK